MKESIGKQISNSNQGARVGWKIYIADHACGDSGYVCSGVSANNIEVMYKSPSLSLTDPHPFPDPPVPYPLQRRNK